MKQLAFFALEGKLLQGPHEVWVTLGRFESANLAQTALNDPRTVKNGIVETRVVPMYRISDALTPALRDETLVAAQRHDSVTVA